MVRVTVCPYRLLFKHPFGTAHGIRTGTDSVFVRLEQDGTFGYGEATMPPYVTENQRTVMTRLAGWSEQKWSLPGDLGKALDQLNSWVEEAPSARAALSMALIDLAGKVTGQPAWKLMGAPFPQGRGMMMTLGICDPDEIPQRLAELPDVGILKVKLNGEGDMDRLRTVVRHWRKTLFLDVNQGWNDTAQVAETVAFIEDLDVAGIEQPYGKDDIERNARLQGITKHTVFADETIQGPKDLLIRAHGFGGVNIKLQKCGGPDVALGMAQKIRAMGKHTMLGSMSESSLGCTAAAHLGGLAELLDLDGPWLIQNDPFHGLELQNGLAKLRELPGIGTELRAELGFTSFGA